MQFQEEPPEDPSKDVVLDLDAYEALTGDTSQREYRAWRDMLRQEYLTGISSNWWETTPNAYPVDSSPPVVPSSPPVVIDNSVTVTVSLTYTPQEGFSYAEFVIQVQWIGLSDTPLSVRVQEFSQTTFGGATNQLHETWLTFDSSHVTQSVLVPIADDSDWLPQNSLGVAVTLGDPTLTLNSNSVLQMLSPVLENDTYFDPVTGEPDDTNYWLTAEAAQLRSSPYAMWYSLWLPIYESTDTESSETELSDTDPSDGQSSPPYVDPNESIVSTDSSQSSPPIIVVAPVDDSSSSQSSSPPNTEPIVVVGDSSGAGSSVEMTSAMNSSSSGGSSSSDMSLMTATYEAGLSGIESGSTSSGSTSGTSTDSSSSNSAAMYSAISTATGNSSQSSTSTELLGNQNSTSESSAAATSSSSATTNNSSNMNSSDDQFVESPNTMSVMDLLLIGGDSMQGGSSADPTLGSGAMLYMGSNGNVLMA